MTLFDVARVLIVFYRRAVFSYQLSDQVILRIASGNSLDLTSVILIIPASRSTQTIVRFFHRWHQLAAAI